MHKSIKLPCSRVDLKVAKKVGRKEELRLSKASLDEQLAEELLDARVRRYYDEFPPSEKRLADLLLNFPGDITDYSASELCELANTSNAAASRFFRRIGYKDYNDARRQTREAKKWGAPLYQSHAQSSSDTPKNSSQIIDGHIQRELANLQRTLEGIDPNSLRDFAKAFHSSKRVMVLGYRNSRFLAEYFQRQLSLLRGDVTLHPGPAQSVAEELFDLGEGDLLIAIGMRRRTAILERTIDFAAQQGATVALIADPTAASLEKRVRWKFPCILHSTSAFDSYSSAMSVMTLLVNTALELDDKALDRLRRIENVHEQLAELHDNGVHVKHPGKL